MTNGPTRILGLDPGLRRAGWGVIVAEGARLRWVAHGVVSPPDKVPFSERLLHLLDAVGQVCTDHACPPTLQPLVIVQHQHTTPHGHAGSIAVCQLPQSL